MKKRLAVFLGLMLFAGVAAGCGGPAGKNDTYLLPDGYKELAVGALWKTRPTASAWNSTRFLIAEYFQGRGERGLGDRQTPHEGTQNPKIPRAGFARVVRTGQRQRRSRYRELGEYHQRDRGDEVALRGARLGGRDRRAREYHAVGRFQNGKTHSRHAVGRI